MFGGFTCLFKHNHVTLYSQCRIWFCWTVTSPVRRTTLHSPNHCWTNPERTRSNCSWKIKNQREFKQSERVWGDIYVTLRQNTKISTTNLSPPPEEETQMQTKIALISTKWIITNCSKNKMISKGVVKTIKIYYTSIDIVVYHKSNSDSFSTIGSDSVVGNN